jgi:hypothetical protein
MMETPEEFAKRYWNSLAPHYSEVREVTRAMLNSRMTLSERVAELERRMTATERDIAVLKAKAQVK